MHIMTNGREKNKDFITYKDIMNSQGKIKTWQRIGEEGEKRQWLVYFQLISRLCI